MWVTKLMISQVKKRIFCPKTTKFGPKLAFLVDLGQAMQAYSVPCLWVGWWLWHAGCISQDTYLLYYINFAAEMCCKRSKDHVNNYRDLTLIKMKIPASGILILVMTNNGKTTSLLNKTISALAQNWER